MLCLPVKDLASTLAWLVPGFLPASAFALVLPSPRSSSSSAFAFAVGHIWRGAIRYEETELDRSDKNKIRPGAAMIDLCVVVAVRVEVSRPG